MRHQVEAIADELPSMEEPPKAIGGEGGVLAWSVTDNAHLFIGSRYLGEVTIKCCGS
jgi:hypothetical protein